MKGKQNNVCHTCRTHKIGCDGALPSCTQCRLTGRRCGGYKQRTVFISYSAPEPRSLSKSLTKPPNVDNASPNIVHSKNLGIVRLQTQPYHTDIPYSINPTSPIDLTAIIVSRFLPKHRNAQGPSSFDTSTSQVCGAWVEMLPSMISRAAPDQLITFATRAFGLAVLDRGPEGRFKNFHSVKAYVSTLEKLRSVMRSPGNFFRVETAAAIVCLAMVELMLPESESNTLAHFGGLGALINMYSPEVFQSGDFHVIFVGCRPVLLLQALTARKSTFLGLEEWLRIPFRKHPPSEMQSLLGDIAILPSILEDIDHLQSQGHNPAPNPSPSPNPGPNPSDLKTKLCEILSRLSKWDDHFEISQKPSHVQAISHSRSQTSTSPSTSPSPSPSEAEAEPYPNLWFPNLLAANILIHVWSFQILCITELSKLHKLFPNREVCSEYHHHNNNNNCNLTASTPKPKHPSSSSSEKEDQEEVEIENKTKTNLSPQLQALATKISQSIPYMLQDSMLLYGPAAAMWPLATAYSVLISTQDVDVDDNRDQLARCRYLLGRIRGRGFLSAPFGGLG